MKIFSIIICCLLIHYCVVAQNTGRKIPFDDGWKFFRGGAQGAENPAYDDSRWRKIDLPHDWSIEDVPGTKSPFDSSAISQVSGGFTLGGSGWYRKTFSLPASANEKRLIIMFDGVYMNADVYVNGELIGTHPYGYTSFYFDLTGKVKADTLNTIALQVKNEGQNSRWYTGSGIYRHVWLIINDDVHIMPWSTSVTTTGVTKTSANINIKTKIRNAGKNNLQIKAIVKIHDPNEKETIRLESVSPIVADSMSVVSFETKIANPKLWSVQSPHLYKAVIQVYAGNKLTHEETTTFGIRSISFDTSGFHLNGETVKLKGGCVHHDNGPLGSKAYDRAEIRRVQLLKANGYNAIRSSHNPPSPTFLDACDSLGMLVIDEAFDMWRNPNNPHDYHLFFDKWWKKDIESMVLRDRNHPSVIMWSIGNEIRGMNTPEVVEVAKMLSGHVRLLDPTRPVTAAVNGLGPDKDSFIATLDVAGYNYAAQGDHNQADIYALDHPRKPGRIMFGSESYAMAAFQSWKQAEEKPWVLGDFVWTSFDYIGEASIGWRGYYQKSDFYPWNLAFCGDIDICGWKRPQSYYRDALWKKDQLSLFVKPPVPSFPLNPQKEFWSRWEWHDVVADWNWDGYEGKSIEVNVYSSCERVELLLNGKSLGIKKTDAASEYIASWKVPYEKGTLTAIGYNGKNKIKTTILKTASHAAILTLNADRKILHADGQDLSYITVELKDEDNVTDPKAENKISFSIEGPGTIVGVGNANPMSVESFQLPERKLWRGKCLVIIKAGKQNGEIKLTATADGLKSQSVILNAVRDRPAGIIPYPSSMISKTGTFSLNASTKIYYHPSLKNEADYLRKVINSEHQLSLNVREQKQETHSANNIYLSIKNTDRPDPEKYSLLIDINTVQISATAPQGIFYGIQSLRQLFDTNGSVKASVINDEPRFRWRAFMLDEGRYFKGEKTVKEILDQMALLKMNVFHWHLTDDQGWRIEIKKYPKLTEIGSVRKESEIGTWLSNKFDGKEHKGFYSQEQIKEIIKYAAERHIQIIPEIEMPGHASAAMAAYPWLGTKNEQIEVPTRFMIQNNVYNVANPKVRQFIHDVLDEVMTLFPGNLIHIGGDEVRYDQWKESEEVQQFIKSHNLASAADLQIQFTNEISNYLEKNGHRMIGWNDILGNHHNINDSVSSSSKEKLSQSTIIQFWTGNPDIVTKAALLGHDVINSYWTNTYLDYDYITTTLQKAYNFNPLPSSLPDSLAYKVIGIGAQMWGEWIPTVEKMNYQIYPRIAALAEVGWTKKENKDFTRFAIDLNGYIVPYWKNAGINIMPEQF